MSKVFNNETNIELGILRSIDDIEPHQRPRLEAFVSQGYFIYEMKNKEYGLIKCSKAEIVG